MGRLSDKGLMIHLLVGALEYCICFSHGIYSTGIKPRLVSYTIGLVIFIGAYLTGMRARGKIVESLSKISYPLYAAQGSCYIIMSVLDHEAGLSPYMNILITGVILFIIAYIVSIIVGVPGQLMKAFSSGER